MKNIEREGNSQLWLEEQRFRLDERRLNLDHSFARKWLPTLATIMVGIIAAMFGHIQQQASLEETKRARIEVKAKEEHDWGIKIIEMYFSNREIFDLTKDPKNAAVNLSMLAAVAPTPVKGVLNVELSKIPPPNGENDNRWLERLVAVAGVQNALTAATPKSELPPTQGKPSDFTVYVQYAANDNEIASKAQDALIDFGYRVPGIEKVKKVPSRLQVRYYHHKQKSLAGKLAVELGKSLGLQTSHDNAIFVTSSKRLPDGILEVWLPRMTT